jgi:hypothetical protein
VADTPAGDAGARAPLGTIARDGPGAATGSALTCALINAESSEHAEITFEKLRVTRIHLPLYA